MIEMIDFKDVLIHPLYNNYLSQLNEGKNYVINFNGQWFKPILEDRGKYIGCYFVGFNEILNVNEVYITLYFNNLQSCIFNAVWEDAQYVLKNARDVYDFDHIYYQFYGSEKKTFEFIDSIEKEIERRNIIPITYTVTKDIKDRKSRGIPCNIREATEKDYNKVLDCLVKAYDNAYETTLYGEMPYEMLEKQVKNYYKDSLEKNLILVAEINGEFAGHITYEYIEQFNNSYLKMIDLLVLNRFKNLGLEKKLTEAGEAFANKKEIRRLFGTVEIINGKKGYSKAKRILNNLELDNWKKESIIFFQKSSTYKKGEV